MVDRIIRERTGITPEMIEALEKAMEEARRRRGLNHSTEPITFRVGSTQEAPRPTIQTERGPIEVTATEVVRPEGESVLAKKVRFGLLRSCGVEERVLRFEPPVKIDSKGIYTSMIQRRGREYIQQWLPLDIGLVFDGSKRARRALGNLGVMG